MGKFCLFSAIMTVLLSVQTAEADLIPLKDCADYLIHGVQSPEKKFQLEKISLRSGRSLYFRLDSPSESQWSFDIVQKKMMPSHRKLTILIHGLGESHASMMGIANRLKQERREVLLIELPFHGQQFFDLYANDPNGLRLGALSYRDTLQDLSDAILQIAAEHEYQEIELVGHSLGGGYASFLVNMLSPQIVIKDVYLIAPYWEALNRFHVRQAANFMVPGGAALVNLLNMFTPTQIRDIIYNSTVVPYLQTHLPSQVNRNLQQRNLTSSERRMLRLRAMVIEETIKGSENMDGSTLVSHIPRQIYFHIMRANHDKLLPSEYHDAMYIEMKNAGLNVNYLAIEGSHMVVNEKPNELALWILQSGH